jgi:hypothetical protein
MREVMPQSGEEESSVDLVIALLMGASTKARIDLPDAQLDLFEDAKIILKDCSEEHAERCVSRAAIIAQHALSGLAGLEPDQFFLGACLTSIAMKAFDPEMKKGFKVAVAGLLERANQDIGASFEKLALKALTIATDCNKISRLPN